MLKRACQKCLLDYSVGWHYEDDRNWINGVVFCPVIQDSNAESLRYHDTTKPPPEGCRYALEHTVD